MLWSSRLGGGLRWGRDHIGGVGVTSGHEVLNFPQCLGDSLSVCSSFSALERAAMQLTQFSHSLVSERLPSRGPQHACSGQASLSIANSQSLLKPMSIESVMLSSHLTLCRPLLLLPSVFPSIRVFSSELALHIRWPKYWSFSFSISSSNEHPGLISFRMCWFDLLEVQGTLNSLGCLEIICSIYKGSIFCGSWQGVNTL